MRLSDRGAAFIARHEGFVDHAYPDPVGVLTIGFGFTMRSARFAADWRRRHGRGLAPGDRITRAEAHVLLRDLVDAEYGAAVTRALGTMPQHRHDACCSVVYNLGPRALDWRWATALRGGDVAGAAAILAANYNTAGGRRLAGLARRRREEARLLASGDYGDGRPPAVDEPAPAGTPAPDGPPASLLARLLSGILAAVARFLAR